MISPQGSLTEAQILGHPLDAITARLLLSTHLKAASTTTITEAAEGRSLYGKVVLANISLH